MIDLTTLTISRAATHLKNKDFSAVDLATAYLDVIKKENPDLNAYLEVYDDVIKQAEEADEILASGKGTLLTGIPFAIKDNILIKNRVATAASKILEGFVSPYDATVIEKLKKEHVVFLGRTNMDEFAMGGSTENSAFGPTKNPYDTTRVSGGSSGGSAVAVVMNGALASLGSDTGGSVREPAAFCGLVGLKPTYGGVSRHGLMAMGSSLDVIGTFTKTVTDAELVFAVISGKDERDGTTYAPDTYEKNTTPDKLRIGVPYSLLDQDGIDAEVKKNFLDSLEVLKKKGYEVVDISLPTIAYSLAVYYIIMPAEVSSNMARFDGVKYGMHIDGGNLLADYIHTRGKGFGPEVRRRILLGTYVLSAGYQDAYYNKALLLRDQIASDFTKAFSSVDVIATPTTPVPAFKIGEKMHDPLSMYLADIFTVPANIIGIPALSVPSGTISVDGKNLPLGIQFMAPHTREERLFMLGKDFLGE
jgi:aspartyl-tRNA(Asn)/glutamyl-tRNA(Gln) amidotransferase subunit A